MLVFLDTEFNGFGGELISMALVCEDGREWYEVKQIPANVEPWVAENVIPKLHKEAIGHDAFKSSLHRFLKGIKGAEIVADWPSDLVHFFHEMLGADHSETLQFNCTVRLDTSLSYQSAEPHNALFDAAALAGAYSRKAA